LATDDCPLTQRERQVVLCAMTGRTTGQTAATLGITVSTVRTHRHKALRRLEVDSMGKAMVVMLREGWVSQGSLIPDYAGRPYTSRRSRPWLPSPAQRLYLDAFDRLLRHRTTRAASDVAFYFGVMCRESLVPDRRNGVPDVDAMLLGLALGCLRRIPVGERLCVPPSSIEEHTSAT